MNVSETTIKLDPEWNYMRRFKCGHVQHACCREHLDPTCPFSCKEDDK